MPASSQGLAGDPDHARPVAAGIARREIAFGNAFQSKPLHDAAGAMVIRRRIGKNLFHDRESPGAVERKARGFGRITLAPGGSAKPPADFMMGAERMGWV